MALPETEAGQCAQTLFESVAAPLLERVNLPSKERLMALLLAIRLLERRIEKKEQVKAMNMKGPTTTTTTKLAAGKFTRASGVRHGVSRRRRTETGQ